MGKIHVYWGGGGVAVYGDTYPVRSYLRKKGFKWRGDVQFWEAYPVPYEEARKLSIEVAKQLKEWGYNVVLTGIEKISLD